MEKQRYYEIKTACDYCRHHDEPECLGTLNCKYYWNSMNNRKDFELWVKENDRIPNHQRYRTSE